MIDKGRPVLDGRLAEIRARMRGRRIGFSLPEDQVPPDWLRAQRQGIRWLIESGRQRRLPAPHGGPRASTFSALTVEPLALKDIIARIGQEEQS